MDFVLEMIAKFSKPPKFWNQPRSRKKAMTTTSVQSIWLLLLDDTLWNPIARCTRCKNLRYARIAWEILRRHFIQSKLSTNWSPKQDQGATTGLLCVLQNGSPIFHNFLDTMLTQNTWCWWAGGVPWGHHFVGNNPHGCYHFVGARSVLHCHGVWGLRQGPWTHGVWGLRQGPWTRADGRKQQGLKLVSRQFRKQRLAVWAAGRGPDPSFTAMVFEACDRVLGLELTAGKSKVWS